jgi:hypothetical protein
MNAGDVERSAATKWELSGPASNISGGRFAHRFYDDPRWKAWPRGLRPLRCSFTSLRMTNRKG